MSKKFIVTDFDKQAILLLRFKSANARPTDPVYMTIDSIAHLLNLHAYKVRLVLDQHRAMCRSSSERRMRRRRKNGFKEHRQKEKEQLEQAFEFLSRPSILQDWAHLTLDQRCKRIATKFPMAKLASQRLSEHYRKSGIRLKVIKKNKFSHRRSYNELNFEFKKSRQELVEQIEKNSVIAFFDEVHLTNSVLTPKAFAPKHKNIWIDKAKMDHPAGHMVCGVTR